MNKHNIPGVRVSQGLALPIILLVSKAHLSPLTFHQILPGWARKEREKHRGEEENRRVGGMAKAPRPSRRDEWDNPGTDHTSRTPTATDGAVGGERGWREATALGKEAGAKASRESTEH